MRQGIGGVRKGGGEDAVLGGVSLLALDSRITLTDAQEIPAWETSASERAGLDGQFPAAFRRRSLEIRLTVHLKAWNAAERGLLYQKLCLWASPGTLKVSWRPGQELQVDTAYAEGLPSVTAWTRTVTLRLTAHLRPFFRDEAPETWTQTGADVLFPLTPGGSAGAQAEVSCVNQQTQELPWVLMETILDGERLSYLYLTDLALPGGGRLDAAYDSFGLLKLTKDGASALACRTGESSDELVLLPGRAQILHVSALRRMRVDLAVYGLYL